MKDRQKYKIVLEYESIMNTLNVIREIIKDRSNDDLKSMVNNVKGQRVSEERQKLPNYELLKYIFNNYLVDHVVFITLNMVHQIDCVIKQSRMSLFINHPLYQVRSGCISRIENINSKEDYVKTVLHEQKIRLIEIVKHIFINLFQELNEDCSAAAPYVDQILNNMIKLMLGEDYMLISE